MILKRQGLTEQRFSGQGSGGCTFSLIQFGYNALGKERLTTVYTDELLSGKSAQVHGSA